MTVKLIQRSAWVGTLLLAALAVSIAGCAVRSTDEHLLAAKLRYAQEQARVDQTRMQALEARVAQLEHETAVRAAQPKPMPRQFDDPRMLAKLEELLAVNQRMLEEVEAARKRAEAEAPAAAAPALAPEPPPQLSREERLRQIVYEMHGNSGRWRGGLSLEQAEALRTLLRSERRLDADNPWSE